MITRGPVDGKNEGRIYMKKTVNEVCYCSDQSCALAARLLENMIQAEVLASRSEFACQNCQLLVTE